ncbi:hypothetical protein QTO34_001025 [Cnephaeus nilssonii]|uniref:Uncharacterized protein n=1 Tax=Cnephaeus nilssonii TaxID=3371016 RepID=A0AA40HUX9_CNENI|nr:hypothetical protein QTO34_001025 [Eptesicus nilssonii]
MAARGKARAGWGGAGRGGWQRRTGAGVAAATAAAAAAHAAAAAACRIFPANGLLVSTEMETKKNSQLLVPLILLSVLFSQTWALPLVEAEALSNDISEDQRPIKRQADAILLKDYTRFPQQNPENEYLEEVIGKKRPPAAQGWPKAQAILRCQLPSLPGLPEAEVTRPAKACAASSCSNRGTEMGTKMNSQLLLLLILLSVLFSQTWALPPLEAEVLSMLFTQILALFVEAEALRNVRHADGVSTSDISSLLDHHSPKDYPEFLMEKRASNDISEDQRPVKRQSDSEFTAAFNRFLQKKKAKKQPKKKLRRIIPQLAIKAQ